MKNHRLFTLCLALSALGLSSCASTEKKAPPPEEAQVAVLPQHKEEVTSIYLECLDKKHGEMIACIQKGVTELEQDVPILTDSAMKLQASEEFKGRANTAPKTKESIARGEEVFQFFCSACHGTDGRGSSAEASFGIKVADLTSPALASKSDGELFWKITEGGWPMPAFWEGDALSENDIWMLIHYLRTLSVK